MCIRNGETWVEKRPNAYILSVYILRWTDIIEKVIENKKELIYLRSELAVVSRVGIKLYVTEYHKEFLH